MSKAPPAEPLAPRILIVDDQRAIREELAYGLGFHGYRTLEAVDGQSAIAACEGGDIALVLLDVKMPGMDGLEVLEVLHQRWPEVPVVMISGHGDVETAVIAVKRGAFDFLPKPFDTDRVLVSAKNALRVSSLERENVALRDQLVAEHRLIGESPPMQELRKLIERSAPTEAQVLVTGENGTGKELVARQLHALSKRRRGPFVAVNCAAIPATLIESELFGHERGAFTGAQTARKGHFEAAEGGTLFLDEIGDMAMDAQSKLLRALQERNVTRIGGSRPIQVDVRVIAATNQDLEARVKEGAFREDLYYRLHVVPIRVPALRERGDDVSLLAAQFLADAARRNGLSPRKLAKDAAGWLRAQDWPGNVRQLRNLCEAATILTDAEEIDAAQLAALSTASNARPPQSGDYFAIPTLEEFREAIEKEFIRRKLEENSGNIKRTAERIGIQRSNLYKKLERYGMK
ncbi:MAG: sigma-54-dependent Fis family transcriptional regulator [Planctomycetes bacterium]|nr:sigma-54-dependent Fis family transcriptional regulator [Planctomycetota bacterium]